MNTLNDPTPLSESEIDLVSGAIFNPPPDAKPVPGHPGFYYVHGVPILLLDI